MLAIVKQLQPYELHGTRYYQIFLTSVENDAPIQVRLSSDMIDGNIEIGNQVKIHSILGVIDRITLTTLDE
tara:strand:- start:79 stop:291 length:213 start_codon:yes stop_codon:yes gene_type:complete